jgi:hypothetical protein
VITGKVCRDCTFKDCTFLKKAADVACRLIYATGATDVERRLVLRDCLLIAAKLGAAAPAQAIASAASLTEGYIVCEGSTGCVNCTKVSTTTGVIILAAATSNAAGIGVNCA